MSNYQSGQILTAAELNASLNSKADLDPSTGQLSIAEMPVQPLSDIVSAHTLATTAETDAQTGITNAGVAHTLATTAETDAQTGITNAGVAHTLAQSAFTLATTAEADAQNAIAGLATKVTLVSGKVPLINLPYTAGANITIDPTGIIASTGGGSSGPTLTRPLAANFTPFNWAGCTLSDGANGMLFHPDFSTENYQLRGVMQSINFAVPFTATAHIKTIGLDYNGTSIGVGIRNSATGLTTAFVRGQAYWQNSYYVYQNQIFAQNFKADNTTIDISVSNNEWIYKSWNSNDVWWNIKSDGTIYTISISADGVNYFAIDSHPIAWYCAANQIGIVGNSFCTPSVPVSPILHNIDSWSISYP
jgi:hypothetical protein